MILCLCSHQTSTIYTVFSAKSCTQYDNNGHNTTYQSLWVTMVVVNQVVKEFSSSKQCCYQITGIAILNAFIYMEYVRCMVKDLTKPQDTL